MSSIEKALERLMKSREPQDASPSLGTVETVPDAATPDVELHEEPPMVEEIHVVEPLAAVTPGRPAPEAARPERRVDSKKIHLDWQHLASAGFLTPDSPNHQLAEEYRMIKRPLLSNAYGKGAAPVEHGNLILVTSAVPGEGKTYTTINLAISIAMELDSTVLLIDGDVIQASLSRQFGLQDEPGLMELIATEGSRYRVSDVMLATDLPRLRIVPAGRLVKNPTELLSSIRMKSLVDELAQRYNNRIVVFDAPPILATTEAASLIDHVGQVLFVVEAGKTPSEMVVNAISQINHQKVIGTVLNKSRYRSRHNYYGGYYGNRNIDPQDDAAK